MKKKGDVEYGEEAEKMLYELLDKPKTIGELTKDMQNRYGLKIHYYTVERLIEELQSQGLIVVKKVSRFKVCERT